MEWEVWGVSLATWLKCLLTTFLSLVTESLRYEHSYVVVEDYPSEERKLRSGDHIMAVSPHVPSLLGCVKCVAPIRLVTKK